MKQLLSKKIGLVFIIIQFLLTVGLIGLILYVDILPEKYLLVIAVVLIFLLAYTFFSQMAKKMYIVGRVLSGIFCVIIIVGAAYLWRGFQAINNMSDVDIKVDEVSAIVLVEDPAQSVDDAVDYEFGILKDIGREYTDSMLNNLETELGKKLLTKEYEDAVSLVDALYNKEIKVIIFNEAFREMITELHENFETETRVLGNHQIETVVDITEEEDKVVENDDFKKPFIIYCSGIDTYGKISKTSRSDVNIVAVVNPETAQILLINTPRDYYVPLSISNGKCDKLTHAGIYGVDVSVETLEMLYDIDIDYYARVNFSGLTDIVDALGGVKVYSDFTFTSDWGPSFKEGYNEVNGKQALAFCRERHHLGSGDLQRGINHQHMITAIIDKATSPAVLKNFNKLMDSVEGAFETNMKTKKITKFVKMQMDENPKWNIESMSAGGTGGKTYTYSMPGQRSYVMYPDEDTISEIQDAIKTILDGKKLKKNKDKEDGKDKDKDTGKDSNESSQTKKSGE